jgi:hypothetical protein
VWLPNGRAEITLPRHATKPSKWISRSNALSELTQSRSPDAISGLDNKRRFLPTSGSKSLAPLVVRQEHLFLFRGEANAQDEETPEVLHEFSK